MAPETKRVRGAYCVVKPSIIEQRLRLRLRSRARKVLGVQLYKNNARALLSRNLSIVNSAWLQHARSVRGVYDYFQDYAVPLNITNTCKWQTFDTVHFDETLINSAIDYTIKRVITPGVITTNI